MRKKVNEGLESRSTGSGAAQKEERKQSRNGSEGISMNGLKEIVDTGRNKFKGEVGENWAAGV